MWVGRFSYATGVQVWYNSKTGGEIVHVAKMTKEDHIRAHDSLVGEASGEITGGDCPSIY
jgi:hypothetical protein